MKQNLKLDAKPHCFREWHALDRLKKSNCTSGSSAYDDVLELRAHLDKVAKRGDADVLRDLALRIQNITYNAYTAYTRKLEGGEKAFIAALENFTLPLGNIIDDFKSTDRESIQEKFTPAIIRAAAINIIENDQIFDFTPTENGEVSIRSGVAKRLIEMASTGHVDPEKFIPLAEYLLQDLSAVADANGVACGLIYSAAASAIPEEVKNHVTRYIAEHEVSILSAIELGPEGNYSIAIIESCKIGAFDSAKAMLSKQKWIDYPLLLDVYKHADKIDPERCFINTHKETKSLHIAASITTGKSLLPRGASYAYEDIYEALKLIGKQSLSPESIALLVEFTKEHKVTGDFFVDAERILAPEVFSELTKLSKFKVLRAASTFQL
ncbi:hypothetical protein ACYPKM_05475 [Pseudomonas aeruginosa]